MSSELLLVPALAILVFFVICAVKESKVTAKYKAFGVYGRFKAYLFIDMLLAGPIMIVGPLVPSLREGLPSNPLVSVAGGFVCMVIAILIFAATYSKCPSSLRGRLLGSMIVTGFGVAFKMSIFFLFFVWKMVGPVEYVDQWGNRVYAFNDGDVYDGCGNLIGKMDGYGRMVRYSY